MRHGQIVLIDDVPGIGEEIQIQRSRTPALAVPYPPMVPLDPMQLLQQVVGVCLGQQCDDGVDEVRLISRAHWR